MVLNDVEVAGQLTKAESVKGRHGTVTSDSAVRHEQGDIGGVAVTEATGPAVHENQPACCGVHIVHGEVAGRGDTRPTVYGSSRNSVTDVDVLVQPGQVVADGGVCMADVVRGSPLVGGVAMVAVALCWAPLSACRFRY